MKKAACSQAALCKEAKEEGKSLRKGDARCSPDLRQDTRIEEVSILGRGLKSLFSFTCLFICYLYKQLGNQSVFLKNVKHLSTIKPSWFVGFTRECWRDVADFGIPHANISVN